MISSRSREEEAYLLERQKKKKSSYWTSLMSLSVATSCSNWREAGMGRCGAILGKRRKGDQLENVEEGQPPKDN